MTQRNRIIKKLYIVKMNMIVSNFLFYVSDFLLEKNEYKKYLCSNIYNNIINFKILFENQMPTKKRRQ